MFEFEANIADFWSRRVRDNNFSVGLTLASPHFVKSTFEASDSENANVVDKETIDAESRLYALARRPLAFRERLHFPPLRTSLSSQLHFLARRPLASRARLHFLARRT